MKMADLNLTFTDIPEVGTSTHLTKPISGLKIIISSPALRDPSGISLELVVENSTTSCQQRIRLERSILGGAPKRLIQEC